MTTEPRTADADLASRLREGDVTAYEELYRRHGARLYNLACRMLRHSMRRARWVIGFESSPAFEWKSYLDSKVVHFAYFYLLWLHILLAVKAPSITRASSVVP